MAANHDLLHFGGYRYSEFINPSPASAINFPNAPFSPFLWFDPSTKSFSLDFDKQLKAAPKNYNKYDILYFIELNYNLSYENVRRLVIHGGILNFPKTDAYLSQSQLAGSTRMQSKLRVYDEIKTPRELAKKWGVNINLTDKSGSGGFLATSSRVLPVKHIINMRNNKFGNRDAIQTGVYDNTNPFSSYTSSIHFGGDGTSILVACGEKGIGQWDETEGKLFREKFIPKCFHIVNEFIRERGQTSQGFAEYIQSRFFMYLSDTYKTLLQEWKQFNSSQYILFTDLLNKAVNSDETLSSLENDRMTNLFVRDQPIYDTTAYSQKSIGTVEAIFNGKKGVLYNLREHSSLVNDEVVSMLQTIIFRYPAFTPSISFIHQFNSGKMLVYNIGDVETSVSSRDLASKMRLEHMRPVQRNPTGLPEQSRSSRIRSFFRSEPSIAVNAPNSVEEVAGLPGAYITSGSWVTYVNKGNSGIYDVIFDKNVNPIRYAVEIWERLVKSGKVDPLSLDRSGEYSFIYQIN